MILADKLESLRRCVARIEERRAAGANALENDVDAQDILTLNLTRAIQLCVDASAHVLAATDQPTPRTMGEAFDLLAAEGVIPSGLAARMRAAVGFRTSPCARITASTGRSCIGSRTSAWTISACSPVGSRDSFPPNADKCR